MRNKELQDELQKWGDDTDVSIALLQSFVERLNFVKRSDRVSYAVCEFGVALEKGCLQLTPYFVREENRIIFSNPALEACAMGDYGIYSANPDDYFTVGDDHIFVDRYLTCTCVRDGWTKQIIVKENPTKVDLRNWKELAEKVEI